MVDNIAPTKEQLKAFKAQIAERFKLMMDEYKAAPYSRDRKRPTRDDARAAVIADMPAAQRQMFVVQESAPVPYEDLTGADKLFADVGNTLGDAFSGLSSTVSDATSAVVGQPTAGLREDIREGAKKLPAQSEQVVGNASLGIAGFAAPFIERFTGTTGAKEAIDVVRGTTSNPIAGIANEAVSSRFSMLSDALESFGIDLDGIEEYGVNAGAVSGLLGKQTDIQDARDLISIVDGALKEFGLEDLLGSVDKMLNLNVGFTSAEKEIGKMPDGIKVPVLAAKGLVDSIKDLQELIVEFDATGTTEERKKMIGLDISRIKFEVGAHINDLANTVAGIPAALENVPGKRIHNIVRGGIKDAIGEENLELMQEPVVGSGLRAVGAAINDDEHLLQRALGDLGEMDLAKYLPEPGADASPEEIDDHRRQKEFLSTTIEGIVALMTSTDASVIEKRMEAVVQKAASETGEGGLFEEMAPADLSQEAADIAEGTGKLLSGQEQTSESTDAIGRVIGSEAVDQITSNPKLMAALFGGTALGLGGLGGMLGSASGGQGMGAFMGASMPMLAPVVLRGIMGDQYTEGMQGINDMMAPFTDKLFNMIPDAAYETPLLGNILGAAKDNPMGTSMFAFGSLTGNDAFQDASTGMMIANLLYGDSANRDDQAQATDTGPSGQTASQAGTSANAVSQQSTSSAAPTSSAGPDEGVGATTRSTDASAVYALSLADPRNHSRFQV